MYDSQRVKDESVVSIYKGENFEKKLRSNKYFKNISNNFDYYIEYENNYRPIRINEDENYDSVKISEKLKETMYLEDTIELYGQELPLTVVSDIDEYYFEISKSLIDNIALNSDVIKVESYRFDPLLGIGMDTDKPIEKTLFSKRAPNVEVGKASVGNNEVTISLDYANKILKSHNPIYGNNSIEEIKEFQNYLLKEAYLNNLKSSRFKNHFDNYINMVDYFGRKVMITGITSDNSADIYINSEAYDKISEKFYKSYYYSYGKFDKDVDIKYFSKFLANSTFMVEQFSASYQYMGVAIIFKQYLWMVILLLFTLLLISFAIMHVLDKEIAPYLKKRNSLLVYLGANKKNRKKEQLFVRMYITLISIISTFVISTLLFALAKVGKFMDVRLLIWNIIPYLIIMIVIIALEVILHLFFDKKINKIEIK